jgi:hypothetical protein
MRARRDRGGPKPRRQDPLGLAERKRTGGTVNPPPLYSPDDLALAQAIKR